MSTRTTGDEKSPAPVRKRFLVLNFIVNHNAVQEQLSH